MNYINLIKKEYLIMRKDLMKHSDFNGELVIDKNTIKSVSDIKFLKYLYNFVDENINDFLNEDAYGGDMEACSPLWDIEDILKVRIKQLQSKSHAE